MGHATLLSRRVGWRLLAGMECLDYMLFNSLEFLIFLPIVFTGYWLLARHLKLQNLFVVVASYVFYGWWDWRFLILIAFTSLWSFAFGLFELKCEARSLPSKLRLALSCVINLGILGYFKYCDFFVSQAAVVLRQFGFEPHVSSLNIILPVGISFYTFQALSYTIDVYRHSIKPTKDPIAFFAFISFFPQLVAGPIERATNLLPQFLKPRQFDYPLAVEGCRQMLWGFFKKMVVADGCALAANNLLTSDSHSSLSLLVGLFCFSMQIYGDFSGYSDIAIGASKTFGIRLMRNFDIPYFARNIGEFWRRWHISLTTWFKDYLYIPLGGSRKGRVRTIINTFVIFVVSGFWHGASWTFIMWGVLHAVAFVPSLLLGTNRRHVREAIAEERWLPSLADAFGMFSTFLVVMLGWAFFRADTVGQSFMWVKEILFGFDFSIKPILRQGAPHAVLWTSVMLLCEWVNRKCEFGFARYPVNASARYLVYWSIMLIIVLNLSPRQTFIYFQF